MKRQISLKWKIARYLAFFGALVIVLLFVFQVILLEPMYERYKLNMIHVVSDNVVNALDNDDLDEVIYQNQAQNDTCIRVFQSGDAYDANLGKPRQGCRLYRMSPFQMGDLIASALSRDDGTVLAVDESESFSGVSDEEYKSLILTRIVDGEDGKIVVMVQTGISAVNPATQTIKAQLIYIGVILLLMIVILTVVIYREIANPLVLINHAAKSLPDGEYQNNQKTNRYLEAQELNATLVKAAADIKKADRAKRDLIANVSHDLRTPLTMIGGYGEMMIDLPEEKTDENIQVIIDEAKRLGNLVNDLLDLSKMQEDKIEMHKEVFDLALLVKTQLQKYEVYKVKEGFEIESHLVDEAMIFGDSIRIGQVFNNFMTNAINYSGNSRSIIVSQEIVEGNVITKVRDFGEGIAEDALNDVWDRYFKVDKEHVRVSSGSGIGLAIAKEILDLHGAKYGVESKLSEGSTFWFSLPLHSKAE